MAAAARDRLARMLRGDVKSAFSVELTARPDDLSLEVDGFGTAKFPVTPAKARKLIGLGQPARFGRGEETVTDLEVRDTWEIPKHLVHATWNEPMLKVILETVKEELGLPNGGVLTADLHSLLVYEPNQFFLAHQDSEKDDAMVGTLVVTLPSSYSGGELMVGHNEELEGLPGLQDGAVPGRLLRRLPARGSPGAVGLPDHAHLQPSAARRHQPPGRRGEASSPSSPRCCGSTSPRQFPGTSTGQPAEVPNRLVYLLDHEYTPRALSWTRLKGADAARASLLRTAAERRRLRGHPGARRPQDHRTARSPKTSCTDTGDAGTTTMTEIPDDDGDRTYEIQELIDSEVTLTHWTGPDGGRLEETSLSVNDGEVCASTETGDLTPYSTPSTRATWATGATPWTAGTTGRRSWCGPGRRRSPTGPRPRRAGRSTRSPRWPSAGDVAGARDAAASLAPFWDRAVRGLIPAAPGDGPAAGLLASALRTAAAVADAPTATSLLKPFRVESLHEAHAGTLATVASDYGQQWTADLLRIWFGDGKQAWEYGAGAARPRWVADRLPGLCQALHATAGDGADATAHLLLDLSWAWLASEIDSALALPGPKLPRAPARRPGQAARRRADLGLRPGSGSASATPFPDISGNRATR